MLYWNGDKEVKKYCYVSVLIFFKADDPLFSWLSDELKGRKTYSTFMKLMDNYASETGQQEDITEEEIKAFGHII